MKDTNSAWCFIVIWILNEFIFFRSKVELVVVEELLEKAAKFDVYIPDLELWKDYLQKMDDWTNKALHVTVSFMTSLKFKFSNSSDFFVLCVNTLVCMHVCMCVCVAY